ncbi:MAG: DUF2934 domain-containing protein [Candidatus Omnitrophica bacterium]|nr:DUF2934 domain-containing protein [Candidatus Omnitrophota bacterium]
MKTMRGRKAKPARRTPAGGQRREVLPEERGQAASKEAHVRRKAYELYANRGYEPGEDLSDWFEAERLVEEELRRRT